MHVFLFPAPSLSFLGQEQACGLLCPFGLSALKAVNGMGLGFWAPPALPSQIGLGGATCWERRKKEGHLASVGLQDASGNRWEGWNVGALQNVVL